MSNFIQSALAESTPSSATAEVKKVVSVKATSVGSSTKNRGSRRLVERGRRTRKKVKLGECVTINLKLWYRCLD